MMINKGYGFTLIEVLVVIAITGLVSVLTLQMLTIMFRGYDQVSQFQSEMSQESMRNAWFRDSIAVMVASLDEEFSLKGDTRSIAGFTLAPLLGHPGKITPISWTIEADGNNEVLWYEEEEQSRLKIASWESADVSFAYRGQRSGWLPDWPPEDLSPGVLPFRIKLSIDESGKVREVFAAVKIRRTGRN
ncbi:MAG: prepilin-type N-terminal cleavage/methylation domain-containing protein, partial [Candidatus Azotimanducaceae bacterium]